MSTNTYKSRRRAQARVTALVILIIVYLVSVATWDAFVASPKKAAQIEVVHNKFNDMKTYLDAKLPQIDSALYRHEIQLDDQNEQLAELNDLTEILKEE
jgi:negative regulator of sigma E activity